MFLVRKHNQSQKDYKSSNNSTTQNLINYMIYFLNKFIYSLLNIMKLKFI